MSNSRQQTAVLTADNQINNVPMAKIKSGCAAQQRGGGLFKKSFVETDAFISGTISGLIGGLSIEDAVAQGSKCGAAVAATRGDRALMITGEKGILNYGGKNG